MDAVMAEKEVSLTFYHVNGLLTWEQLYALFNIIEDYEAASDQEQYDMICLKSMVLNTPMEGGRTFGELLCMIESPNVEAVPSSELRDINSAGQSG